MLGKNASVCYCCRFLVFSATITNRANSNAAFGRSKKTRMKDLFHKMLENRFSLTKFPVYCRSRCICDARPLAHPVR